MRPRSYSPSYGSHDHDEAVKTYAPLVRKMAFQIASRLPPNVEVDDLVQEGMMGLLDALKRYQPQPGLSFEVYARTRIRGSIYDACRRNDMLPRNQRDRIDEIQKATRILEQQLGRAPTEQEVADQAGMTLEEYFDALDCAVDLTAIDDVPEDMMPADDKADPMQLTSMRQFADQIADVLKKLPEKERLVMALHYQEDLSFREVAYVLELTPGRISQLHTQAMVRIRGHLGVKVKAH